MWILISGLFVGFGSGYGIGWMMGNRFAWNDIEGLYERLAKKRRELVSVFEACDDVDRPAQ